METATHVMHCLKAPVSEGKQGRTNAGQTLRVITLETWAILNLAVNECDRIEFRKTTSR